ncbi:MAG: hypothetical protein HYU66_04520 [Armatimonadetes bacterium]|nr:hypothetical protein [Armatimonadota bacterium]
MLLGILLALAAPNAYEYRYHEAEATAKAENVAPRDEGFTSWMAHPSGKRVMVLPEGGWLEWNVTGLQDRSYWVNVRALAWAEGADLEILWDGQPVGRAKYPAPTTALRWCTALGPVKGPGDHTLRVAATPGNRQVPYVDVVLVTSQPDYQPSDEDQDFASYTTPLPVLQLHPDGTRQPLPDAVAADANLEMGAARVSALGLGPVQLGLALRTLAGQPRPLTVTARFGDGPEAQGVTEPAAGGVAKAVLAPVVTASGPQTLRVAVSDGGKEILSGGWSVTVPPAVRFGLDEHAVPLGTARVTWTAALSTADEVARQLRGELVLQDAAGAELDRKATAGQPGTMSATLDTAWLPLGRYRVVSRVLWGERAVQSDERPLFVYTPVPLPAWEPVRETRVQGDTILLNGRPYLGLLAYHAPPTREIAGLGCNLVQCSGGDPDPLPSIQAGLDGCVKAGIYGTVALFNNQFFNAGDHFNLEHIQQAVERFRSHPATWGWDLIDEPEGTIKPEQVAEAARLIRKLDPNHIVWVNLCQPDKGTAYLESQDLWSFDCYPFGSPQGAGGFAAWLKVSDENLRGKRPIGSVMQTWCPASTRMPTPEELRCGTWLHLIHGYKWLGFYSYYDPEPYGCLMRDPVLKSYVRALTAELRTWESVILDPAPWEPLAVEGGDGQVQAAAKRGLAVVVNLAGAEQRGKVKLAGQAAATELGLGANGVALVERR